MSFIDQKTEYKIFSTPTSLVEHRTNYDNDFAQLNLFETRKKTFQFDLQFDYPVVVSMMKGLKKMHLSNKDPFEFSAGQTIIMPASELMYIDFPEASLNEPTQCMALEICDSFVKETVQWLNEHNPKIDDDSWNWTKESFLLLNNQHVYSNISRLIQNMASDRSSNPLTASNTLKELIFSLLQTQARDLLLSNIDKLSTRNRLAHAVRYIRSNLDQKITVKKLADLACLSESHFFRAFQNEIGESPLNFINKERIKKAKQLIKYERLPMAQAAEFSGFSNPNYFSRIFKKMEGRTPTEWYKSKVLDIM